MGQKMGMSDEKRQFRKLFADDEVLHESLLEQNIAVDSPEARGPLGKPDNWLVGRLWLYHGYDLVDSGIKIRRQTPINFYETGPKWRFKHAEAIEREGILDESAQNAWQMAAEDWSSFGNRSIPTTSPFTIKLDQLDELERQKEERMEKFRELTKEVYDKDYQENLDNLPIRIKEILNAPESELTRDEKSLLPSINEGLIPNLPDVAKRSNSAVRLQAVSLVGEIEDLDARIRKTIGYRTQINYPYWKALAQAEQEERTVKARSLIFEAEKANDDAELDKAIELYEQAFAIWEQVFDDYPILTIDDTADDLFDSIRRYMVAIDSQEVPDDFPLKDFAMMMGEFGKVDSEMYQEVRAMAEESAEARRKELEAEEKRLEEEAAKAEMAEAEAKKKAEAEAKAKAEAEAKKKAEEEKAKAEGRSRSQRESGG